MWKWIKKLLLFIVKEISSFCIKFVLALFVLGIVIASITSYVMEKEAVKVLPGSYVYIRASQPLTEHLSPADPLHLDEQPLSFFRAIYALDSIKEDERIAGVVLKVDGASWSKAQIEEIGRKLQEVEEAGKEVIATMSSANQRNYFLASYAKKIAMAPLHAASSNITAYRYEEIYWKKFLDFLGIKVHVIPIGDYKSYMENFKAEKMSTAFRENMTRILNTSYESVMEKIAKNRKLPAKDLKTWVEEGDLMGTSYFALEEKNLVDGGIYWTDLVQSLGGEKQLLSLNNYYEDVKMKTAKQDYIALLSFEGAIEDSSLFLEELAAVEQDEKAKAVLLRIHSPGGSALEAAKMHHAVLELRKKKPVYVSIGGMAASGGYYLAVAGERIFAEDLSVTGSIGVVSMIPNFSGLEGKLELENEEIQKGKYADLYSVSEEMSEENYQRIQEANRGVYEDFLEVVSQGRGLNKKVLDQELAGGRVWLGTEAKKLGLIDGIGGLEASLACLARDKNLGYLPVREISKERILDKYRQKYGKYLAFAEEPKEELARKTSFWQQQFLYFPYEMQ